MSALEYEVNIEDTGLTLLSSHSFIGASSDGRVTIDGSTGVLEIKCPFSLRGQQVNHMEVMDIVRLNYPEFCLGRCEATGDIKLRKKHKFYAQVQGEMAVMSLPWCDFVVWTNAKKNNVHVERIHFDESFVTNMMPKLVDFYMRHIFPIFY